MRVYSDDKSREGELIGAVLKEDTAATQRLLDDGTAVNIIIPDFGGACLLALAAERGDIAMVELLIRCSADVDFASEEGCTPLIHAAESDQTEVARMLIEHGADANVVGVVGTALDVATQRNNAEMETAVRQAGGLTKNEIKYGRLSRRGI